MSFTGKGGVFRNLVLAGAAAALAACAGSPARVPVSQDEIDAYLADKPADMRGVLTGVVAEPEEDRVRNQLRAGLAALEAGHDDLAAGLFDDALLTIEAIYGGDERAEAARGMFSAEDRKIFRGEPYERAMAYYYRGVLYLMEEDYENARASFRSGFLQDGMAEEEEFRQDFSLLAFLEGWASQCNGDRGLADEAFALAREGNAGVRRPGRRENLLVLADLGSAPVKYTDGEYDELLKIRRGEGKTGSAAVRLAGMSRPLPNAEDIARQAMTRGGREFDHVLANKAVFKEEVADAAEAAEAAALGALATAQVGQAMGDYDMAMAGSIAALTSSLFAIGAQVASDSTETAADIRQWDNLPGMVFYGAYRIDGPASPPSISITGVDRAGMTRHGGGEACRIAWIRAPSAAARI